MSTSHKTYKSCHSSRIKYLTCLRVTSKQAGLLSNLLFRIMPFCNQLAEASLIKDLSQNWLIFHDTIEFNLSNEVVTVLRTFSKLIKFWRAGMCYRRNQPRRWNPTSNWTLYRLAACKPFRLLVPLMFKKQTFSFYVVMALLIREALPSPVMVGGFDPAYWPLTNIGTIPTNANTIRRPEAVSDQITDVVPFSVFKWESETITCHGSWL